MSKQSERERLESYQRDCHWVGRTMSPLRGTLKLPEYGTPPPEKPWKLRMTWARDEEERELSLEEKFVLPYLTPEMATHVRDWRCGLEPCTWRRVAELAYEKWDRPEWLVNGHPAYGEALCRLSAAILGEDPNGEEWNKGPEVASPLEAELLRRAREDDPLDL